MPDHYRLLAPVYDRLCHVYSGGRVGQCRRAMIDGVKRGERVLFAGAGHGTEACDLLARGGIEVTVVDRSPAMMRAFRQRLAATPGAGASRPRCRLEDIHRHEAGSGYDWVFANFFLNVFPRRRLMEILALLRGFLRPEGALVIGDFRHPGGASRSRRLGQEIYWQLALGPFVAVAGNAWHPLHDYGPLLARSGFVVERRRGFGWLGLPGYESWLARRSDGVPA